MCFFIWILITDEISCQILSALKLFYMIHVSYLCSPLFLYSITADSFCLANTSKRYALSAWMDFQELSIFYTFCMTSNHLQTEQSGAWQKNVTDIYLFHGHCDRQLKMFKLPAAHVYTVQEMRTWRIHFEWLVLQFCRARLLEFQDVAA